MATPLADRIREARKASGLNRQTIAQRVGVSFKTVQNYETGASAPNSETLARLAEVVDKPIAWFFEPSDRIPLREAAAAAGVTADHVEGAAVLILTVRSGDEESTHELRWVHGPPLGIELTTRSAARSPTRHGARTD